MNNYIKAIIYRPLAVFTVTFFVISSLLFAADTSYRLLSAVIFIFLFFPALCLRLTIGKRKNRRPYFTCAMFFVCGALLASVISHLNFDVRLTRLNSLCEKDTVYFEGYIKEVTWDGGFGSICIVEIESCEGLSDFCCVMNLQGGTAENYSITGKADFSHLESTRPFDERRYYLSNNVPLKANGTIEQIEKNDKFLISSSAKGINRTLSSTLHSLLGEKAGSFGAALLLGNRDSLDDTVSRDFSRLGISHILALSGMHLTVICSFISALLKPLGKRASQLGCALTVIFYMFITGFSASVTRSGIMLLVLILSHGLGYSYDRFTSLGLSVFLICLFDSGSAGDIGLQLSFSAVMAILLFSEKRRELAPSPDLKKKKTFISPFLAIGKSLLGGALLTVIVVLFMLPLEWLYFGEVSSLAPIASPLFSILTTILLWVLPILIILSPANSIAGIFAYPVRLLIELILSLSDFLSHLRGINLSINYPFAQIICILIFVFVTAFCVLKKKKRLVAGILTLCILFSFGTYITLYEKNAQDQVVISLLNHKASDGIFLLSDGKAVLIEIGNGYSSIFDKGVASLSESTATELEAVVLTHVHKSHAGSLDSLFSEVMVRKLFLPSNGGYDLSTVERIAIKHKIETQFYDLGTSLTFGKASVNISDHLYIDRSVQPIIRLDIKAFGKSFCYAGAAYLEAAPDTVFSCDHILFGEHGPLYKTNAVPNIPDNCFVYRNENAGSFITTDNHINLSCKIVLKK